MNNIKNYNKILIGFVILNLLIMELNNYIVDIFNNVNSNMLHTSFIIPSLVVLLTLVLNGIVPSDFKYKLVFWRWYNPLPGTRIRGIINKDPRVSIEQIFDKYGNIPEDPEEQNVFWYNNIYKPNQDSPKILNAHKNFLMTRDITAISFMLLIISILNAIVFDGTFLHIIIVLVEYIIFSILSSIYGKRFVATTIAEAV